MTAQQPAILAKSLLETWLSGDQHRLQLELERVTRAPEPARIDGDSERIELLKGVAGRMKASANLYAARSENPHVGTWMDLLGHLSASDAPASASLSRVSI